MNDVTGMLRLTSSGARVLVTVCVLADLVLAIANLGQVHSPVAAFLSWLLITAVSFSVTLPGTEPMPARRAAATILGTTCTAFIGAWNIQDDAGTSYASWHFGAITLVLIVLGMWGRLGTAWVGFALVVAVTLAWTVTLGHGELFLLELLPNQAGSLVVGTIFAVVLRRQSRRITQLHAEQAALASADSSSRASADERARQSARLNEVARPALERIADDAPYTDDDREAWLRLEAGIRDGLRARSLDSLELAEAARRARERGVEVTLLDDSEGDDRSGAERVAISEAIIAELAGMDSGRLIGRVLPIGRGRLATILVDREGGSRQVDVSEQDEA